LAIGLKKWYPRGRGAEFLLILKVGKITRSVNNLKIKCPWLNVKEKIAEIKISKFRAIGLKKALIRKAWLNA
jgi:hypothetical protein